MIELIYLARLRNRVYEQSRSFTSGGEGTVETACTVGTAPGLVPTDAACETGGRTCRCGRYSLDPAVVFHWEEDCATRRPVAEIRVEIPGLVTAVEKARWARGTQSVCSDESCVAYQPHHPVGCTLCPRADESDTSISPVAALSKRHQVDGL